MSQSRSKSNGRGTRKGIEERRKAREEKREAQKEMQREQGALQQAFTGNGDMSQGFLEELISSEEIDIGEGKHLQTRTVAKLQNMLSRDWVLANLTHAQEHDIRYKLEVLKLKIIGIHPHERGISGKGRAFLMDSREEELDPLTQQERILIDELIETLKARLTRGREGFERTQMNTDIARTETGADDESESDSGFTGLFS